MFLSEWREFPSAPCLAGGKISWWQLASRCCWNRAHPWHASELVSFPVGLRTYQHPGTCSVMYVRILAKSSYYLRHVCPSVNMHHFGSHWTHFREISYCGLLRRSVEKFQTWSKLDTLREDPNKFYCCRRQSVATKALLAAKGVGSGWGWKCATRYVTTSLMLQLRTPLSARYEPSTTNSRLSRRASLVIDRNYFWSVPIATRGQGIIECISSSAHALLLAHGNKGHANAPQP